MRMRQLVQRTQRIAARMPQKAEPRGFRIVLVNPDRTIAGFILMANGTQRRVGPDYEELVDQ